MRKRLLSFILPESLGFPHPGHVPKPQTRPISLVALPEDPPLPRQLLLRAAAFVVRNRRVLLEEAKKQSEGFEDQAAADDEGEEVWVRWCVRLWCRV